jgi:hypothetical protein
MVDYSGDKQESASLINPQLSYGSSSLNEDSVELKDILKKIAERTWTVEDLVVRGSLLPFAFDSTAPFLGKGNYVSHPAISRWVVNRDGTVHIPEVAYSYDGGDSRRLRPPRPRALISRTLAISPLCEL